MKVFPPLIVYLFLLSLTPLHISLSFSSLTRLSVVGGGGGGGGFLLFLE